MGFGPQLVDLDNDGRDDVISGSWPGPVYLFKRNEKREFEDAVQVKDRTGKVIQVGSASAVFACDWDRDGDLDMLIGNIDGDVFFVPRERDGFGTPVKLRDQRKVYISAAGGDAGPCVADWDGDGHRDLLLGCDDGSVRFYRNTSKSGMPVLAMWVELVPKSDHFVNRAQRRRPSGIRAKLAVTDWNADGLSDLLVGDFSSARGERPQLTEEQKREFAAAKQRQRALAARYTEVLNKITARLLAEGIDWRSEEWKKRLFEAQKSDKDLQPVLAAQNKNLEIISKYSAQTRYHGYVWVYLRKPGSG